MLYKSNASIDLGYGFVKATDGKKTITFPSVVGEARTLRYKTELVSDVNPLQNLVVTIDGKSYFVGDLANRQSDIIYFSLNENRIDESNYKVLLLTALGYLSPRSIQVFNIVTGLPVEYYAEYKTAFAELLLGRHTITLHDYAGNSEEKIIIIEKVKILPQPIGTLFNELLGDDGAITARSLAASKVGIVDIGFKTSDFVVADNLEYVDRLSRSTVTALSSAYNLIANRLRMEFKISKPLYQLDEIIHSEEIRISGTTYSLSAMKQYAFTVLSEQIITEVNTMWPNLWELDKILLTGGGGLILSPYLLPRFKNAILVKDPQVANVRGYLKLANKAYGMVHDVAVDDSTPA